jgi:uncharacterized protein (DUF2147 family)
MATITQINPDQFSIQDYTFEDYDIVPNFEVTSLFKPETGNIEFFIYDANSNLLTENYSFPEYTITNDPSLASSDGFSTINLDPEASLINSGFDVGQYNVVYNFFENQLGSSSNLRFYIKEISTDRTELKLSSNNLTITPEIFNRFSTQLQDKDYFNEFYLNFGENKIIIAINTQYDNGDVLIKLYEPLPPQFVNKSTCWVSLKISDPIAYSVSLIQDIQPITNSIPYLKGPNTNLQLKGKVNNSTELKSYEELISTTLTGSYQQVSSLLNEKGIKINVDYTDYSNFIFFSSAEQRLLNFYEKVSLIESSSNQLNSITNQITGSSSSSYYVSGSRSYYQNIIDNTIKNFDGYEYFLYFESSSYAWPKQNSEPPYILYSTGSTEALDWIGNSNENAGNTSPSTIFPYGKYGGMALTASLYDNENVNALTKQIPEYIIDDPQNSGYQLFIEMMGQHFDSIWVYIKDVTNKFNADNRLNYGISKDLVAQAIRDFGLKIYQNQFAQEDLFSAFLGITPSGSLLPSTGSELIETYVTASSDVVALDDANKAIYKRLYHNLPYLLNKKGTIQGIKALIASYGIPNTILRVSEFGGKDRDNSNDWDYWYNKFGYSFYTSGSTFLSSSFSLNSDWGAVSDVPGAVEFRFKSDGIPTEQFSQSLWSTDGGVELQLLYEGSGSASGSYSGSVVDPYNTYGYLNFYPDYSTPANSASVYLPFFDEGWWSVLVNSSSAGYELFAKNRIYIGDDASLLGFQASASTAPTEPNWGASTLSYFTSGSQTIFSGSLQEVRYYKTALSESVFDDYVMNQLSAEGNSLNSAPLDLAFRAPLGSELNTGSLESVHPKITGSWTVTQSFASDSNFAFSADPTFVPGTEYIFLDQPAAGIKNRITDKVKIGDQILPTGSNQVLSQYRSIEQQLPLSQSYTPNINQLEVAFSPQNEINDDIIEQLGYFNLGEYIGDSRYDTSSNTRYKDLSRLANEYFQKYTHNYDVWDYIRLIKYFDNSLFKMIKDFVPAKTSLQSGVVVKQHLLERNRYPQPQLSHSFHYHSGSINVGTFSGGAGGSVNNLNQLANNPYEQSIGTELPSSTLVNQLTQSYSESLDTIGGTFDVVDSTQQEFYNGEYSGSVMIVTTQSLNPECWPYLHDLPATYAYTASIFSGSDDWVVGTSATSPTTRFEDSDATPIFNGYAYFLNVDNNISQIRIAKKDAEGNNISALIQNIQSLSTISELGSTTYTIGGAPADKGDHFLINISNTIGPPTLTKNSVLDYSYSLKTIGSSGSFPYELTYNDDVTRMNFNQILTSEQGGSNTPSIAPFSGSNFGSSYAEGLTLTTSNPLLDKVYNPDTGVVTYYYNQSNQLSVTGPGSYSIQGTGKTTAGSITGKIILFQRRKSSPETTCIPVLETQDIVFATSNGAFTEALTQTSYIDTDTFLSNTSDPEIEYIWGFQSSSSSTNTIPSKLQFTSDLQINVSHSNFGNQYVDALDTIVETSSPTGFLNSDCDVLQGNSEDDRTSGFWMDVDYSTNAAVAVNSSTILANVAPKADVQDSNYTLARQINPRYNGSRSTSEFINTWTSGSTNTYGKLAVADQEKTYFAYFDFINGLSPELKGKTIAHIQFLVDEEGNAIPPDDSKLYITQGTFKTGEQVLVNLNDPLRFEVPMNELNGVQTVVRGGSRVDALLYSDSGSTYATTMSFDTGSFSVTDYQFGSQNTTGNSPNISSGVNLYDGWNNDTLTNAQWSNSTDTFTFSSDTDSPVKFSATLTMRLISAGGALTVYIVKNWTSGTPTPSQILAQDSFGGGGNLTHTFNLDTGYQNFDSGDTVKVIYDSSITGTTKQWNNGANDVFSSLNQINPNGTITAPFWEYNTGPALGLGTTGVWITGSQGVSSAYGSTQLDMIPYDGTTKDAEFDPLISPFTVQIGDEIRFVGAEPYSYMVQDVIYPENATDGLLKLRLDNTLPNAITGSLDHFLYRRYVDDASYIILDSKKPMGSTSPGTIRPEYVTELLEENFPQATEDIIKSIT